MKQLSKNLCTDYSYSPLALLFSFLANWAKDHHSLQSPLTQCNISLIITDPNWIYLNTLDLMVLGGLRVALFYISTVS